MGHPMSNSLIIGSRCERVPGNVRWRRGFHSMAFPWKSSSLAAVHCSSNSPLVSLLSNAPISSSSLILRGHATEMQTHTNVMSPTSRGNEDAVANSPAAVQDIVSVLQSRGLIQDITSPELQRVSSQESMTVYCGFDPTAESLHLGNLLGIIVLSWFQKCGHQPVALLGGATARVGDPSGKSAERPVLSEETIERNTAAIKKTLTQLLAPPPGSALKEPVIVNNVDWFGSMSLLTFLRDVGKHARIGTMLAKESVKRRLESESGISFTEFSYQLLQGYDYLHLSRTIGARVQVGGSDQWGNIIAGTDLVRKLSEQEESSEMRENNESFSENEPLCFGMTFPLLLKSDGSKFGKSEDGAVWLNADMMSPYQMYQFLLKSTDEDVGKFLRMLTFVPVEEIEALEESMKRPDYIPNTAQRLLAEEVTRFVHGDEGVQQALNATAALAPGSKTKLDAAALEAVASDAPTASLSYSEVVEKPLADIMVAAGMQPSKAAVRRLIKGGGVRLNNEKVEDELATVRKDDLIDGRLLLLAAGKKNKLLLKIE